MLVQAVVVFVVVITAMFVAIIRFKVHPFLAMMVAALAVGLGSGLRPTEVAAHVGQGFGGTVGGVGVLVLLGMVFGLILQRSGVAAAIAAIMLRRVGAKRVPLAMNLTGYLVAVPVTFDAAFYLLVDVAKTMARTAKVPLVTVITALTVGLQVTHAMVIPTPGPLAVAGNVGASVPWVLLWSLVVSLPAALIGGVLYGRWLGRRPQYADHFGENVPAASAASAAPVIDDADADAGSGASGAAGHLAPSGALGITLVLLPVALILLGTGVAQFLDEGSAWYEALAFAGHPTVAMLTSVVVAFLVLRRHLASTLTDLARSAIATAAPIVVILGASGALGRMLGQTAIGTELPDVLADLPQTAALGTVMVILAWVVAQVLRFAMGSTTVSLLTSSAIMGPIVATMTDVSPVLVAIAITAGAIGLSLPTNSRFWLVGETAGFDMKTTLRSWTAGLTIAGVVGLVLTIVLSLFAGVLPGLH